MNQMQGEGVSDKGGMYDNGKWQRFDKNSKTCCTKDNK